MSSNRIAADEAGGQVLVTQEQFATTPAKRGLETLVLVPGMELRILGGAGPGGTDAALDDTEDVGALGVQLPTLFDDDRLQGLELLGDR